jgi:hypothetical protein
MQRIVLAILLAFCCVVAQADNGIVINARRVNITSAQQDAETMARTGVLRHCGTAGGMREGIGMGPTPQAAERACCFYNDAMRGRYRIVEKGIARGPRGWFAVIRYE